ncbi:FAD-dependent oxidoreductase [Chloroflexota bacterium]
MPPIGMGGTADKEEEMIGIIAPFYKARARGGVGLIICRSSNVLYKARAPGRLNLYDDKFIPGLRELSTVIHENGARAGIQLNHHGRNLSQLRSYFEHPEEIDVVGASAIPWAWNGIAPREATREDITEIADAFAEATRRAREAGFDIVEILGGHGYLISQFLSPLTNRRTDEYGGSVKNRARLACEIISRVKNKVGADFPVILRTGGSEFLNGGFTIEDTVEQAPLFAAAGADAIDVTAGSFESNHWTVPSYLFPPGPFVHTAAAIKKAVNIPVIAVGKIGDPLFAKQILEEDKADFIAMGRPLLADPDLPNKAKEGRLEDICRCIYCENCFDTAWRPRLKKRSARLSCTVNPTVMREGEAAIKPAGKSKKVMIIGGGPGGMEAAAILAERGHSVTLYEKQDKVGGQWNVASLPKDRKDIYPYLTRHLSSKLTQAGVNIVLNTEVTYELVKQIKPDAAVVATGATPKTLDIQGADGDNVVQAVDVITGKHKVGNRVAVIGGRHIGMELAATLAGQGKRVSLITARELGQNSRFIERNIRLTLRDRLIENDVCIFTHSPVHQITNGGVHFVNSREMAFVRADTNTKG